MTKANISIAIVTCLILVGCGASTGGQNQTVGTVLGAAGGGVLGSTMGKGKGKTATTIAGTVIGGLIGGQVGHNMDRTDQMMAERNASSNFNTGPQGSSSNWHNSQTGASGQFIDHGIYYRNNRPCRDTVSNYVTPDGRSQRSVETFCQGNDGNWYRY